MLHNRLTIESRLVTSISAHKYLWDLEIHDVGGMALAACLYISHAIGGM